MFEVQYIFCMYILKVVVVHTSHLGIILCQFSISHNDSCLTGGVNFENCVIISSKHLVRFNGPYSESVSINTFQSIR